MSQSEHKSAENPKFPRIPDDEVTQNAIKSDVMAYVDAYIEYHLKPLKIQIKSVLDALEIHQRSVDLSIKEVNMRLGAMTGHITKAKNEKRKDYIDFENPVAAVDWVNKVRKANGQKPIDTSIFANVTTAGQGNHSSLS